MAMEYTATQQIAFAAGERHSVKGRKIMREIFPVDKKEGRLLLSQEGTMLQCRLRGPEVHNKLCFVATSMVTGKEVSVATINDSASLCPINPGEKYSVAAYDDTNKPCLLLESQDIQTRESIGEEGGRVKVGLCTLDFPPSAVRDNTRVGVAPCGKDIKELPDDFWSIMPPMDLLSTQEHFDKPVTWKLHFPYLTLDKQIELTLLYLDNEQWRKVCSAQLTENKTTECKISHFTPYVLGVFMKPFVKHAPYDISRRLPIIMTMQNIIFEGKCGNGNFVVLTCLDDGSSEGQWRTNLKGYKKSELLINSFDMTVASTAKFRLKILEPEKVIKEWDVTFNKEFSQSFFDRTLMPIFNDNGELDHKRFLKLAFEREYAGNVYQVVANIRNPFQIVMPGAGVVVNGPVETFTQQL